MRAKFGSAKKVLVSMLFFILLLGMTVQAAKPQYLKKIKKSYDIVLNQPMFYTKKVSMMGCQTKSKFKITNWKVKNARKKGYKKLTFTLWDLNEWGEVSASQVHKMNQDDTDYLFSDLMYAVIDADTGYCMQPSDIFWDGYDDDEYEEDDDEDYDDDDSWYYADYDDEEEDEDEYVPVDNGITVKDSDWKYGKKRYYRDGDGCWIWLRNGSVKVEITYPQDRKNLALAVMGSTSYTGYIYDDYCFMIGKTPLQKTSFYSKKFKNMLHFKKIS